MPTTEHTINDVLAALLRETRRVWNNSEIVSSENTHMLRGNSRRPDILIVEPNVSPVVIEAEVMPAANVEVEAIARLGERLRSNGRPLLSSIALRYPIDLRAKAGTALFDALKTSNKIEMALYSGTDSSSYSRWPRKGWISGSVSDLSVLVQSASIPSTVIDLAADQLVAGVKEAAGLLNDISKSHPASIHKISEHLYQEDGEQTRRMATAILANAFVFQEALAGGPGKLATVNSLGDLRNTGSGLTKSALLAEWQKILAVNYWPIFDIAKRILEAVPAGNASTLIEGLADTANSLVENNLMASHDLTGAVFQRVIADRKFLAAYYTTPASAALLVGLAIVPEAPPANGSWSNPDDVTTLRIADFACGTGTLLSTAYQRIGQLHELEGGDAEAMHPDMMAKVLTGCDVLPAAAHLTASMLSGAHPTKQYSQSSILTVAYGKQTNGIALGSLDLLAVQGKLEILSITAKALEGTGVVEKDTWLSLPDASCDLVIMNPPFTRATGHEGKKVGVPNPMFAAFSSSKEEQKQMSQASSKLTKGTAAHGNAGEASTFLVLGDRKLKLGGTLALVMPLSLMVGDAWEKSRALISDNYADLIFATIAGTEGKHLSFSADTGMGECLIVGHKATLSTKRAAFVVLNSRPAYPLIGATAARQIHQLIRDKKLRCLEDGPLGGTPLQFGDEVIGQAIDAPMPSSGGWSLSRISDLSLAQSAYQLSVKGLVWLPTMSKSDTVQISMTTVGKIGKIGPYHMDVSSTVIDGKVRGPFERSKILPHSVPTYPILWEHTAGLERRMVFSADSEGVILRGASDEEQSLIDRKVEDVLASASHCHFNQNFQFNSQSTAMQFTPRRTIGGRAWMSLRLASAAQEKVLVLWGNTTLGILMHWWYANKQQAGRGNIGKSSLKNLSVLDVTLLTAQQIEAAEGLFNEMSQRDLLPIHQIDRDAARHELDTKFFRDVLGFSTDILEAGGPLDIFRMKLAKEPSIRGSKNDA